MMKGFLPQYILQVVYWIVYVNATAKNVIVKNFVSVVFAIVVKKIAIVVMTFWIIVTIIVLVKFVIIYLSITQDAYATGVGNAMIALIAVTASIVVEVVVVVLSLMINGIKLVILLLIL